MQCNGTGRVSARGPDGGSQQELPEVSGWPELLRDRLGHLRVGNGGFRGLPHARQRMSAGGLYPIWRSSGAAMFAFIPRLISDPIDQRPYARPATRWSRRQPSGHLPRIGLVEI